MQSVNSEASCKQKGVLMEYKFKVYVIINYLFVIFILLLNDILYTFPFTKITKNVFLFPNLICLF